MQYVRTRRMHLEAGTLACAKERRSAVADRVGYESEVSLNLAFRPWAGVPPGQYRRRTAARAGIR